MQYVSDLALAALATATFGDCNGALAALSTLAAVQFVYRWWRRNTVPPKKPRPADLRAAIAKLPTDQQTIVRLRFLEGRDVHETAARTGLSDEEIKTAQYHALAALADTLTIPRS